MKRSMNCTISIIFFLGINSPIAVFANSFDKYMQEHKLKCLNNEGKVLIMSKKRNVITVNSEGFPFTFEIGESAQKNGNKEQYIVNLGFIEIFIDFENRSATFNILGFQTDLICF